MSVRISQAEISAIVTANVGGRARTATLDRLMPKYSAQKATLAELAVLMRVAGFLGKAELVREIAAAGRRKITALRAQPRKMAANVRFVAAFLADIGQVQTAAQDLIKWATPSAYTHDLHMTAQRLFETGKSLSEEFCQAQNWIDGLTDLRPFAKPDLGFVCNFGLLSMPKGNDSDLSIALTEVYCTAARRAKAAGLTIGVIPDFIFPLLNKRPNHVLAFHTTGRFRGFTHFKRADLPDYLVIDSGGYSGWSSLSGCHLSDLDLPEVPEAAEFVTQHVQEIQSRNLSKYTQPPMGDGGDLLPQSYVFVALQVPNDRTQSMARFSTQQMLTIVVDRFKGSGIAVVVKPHPRAKSAILTALLSDLSARGLIILRHDSIHDLVRQAMAVITINSGVGSESMIYKKPIYTFGASDYDAVTHRISSAAQFNDLTTPIRPAVSEDHLVRFIAYYRQTYLVDRRKAGQLERALQARVIDPILRARNG